MLTYRLLLPSYMEDSCLHSIKQLSIEARRELSIYKVFQDQGIT